jgi:hypothetical protein
MQPCYYDVGQFVLYSVSAVLWIKSAQVRLTPIKEGLEELDKVHLLARDIQRAARWSGGAAVFMALGVVVQGLTILWTSPCVVPPAHRGPLRRHHNGRHGGRRKGLP